MSLDMQICIYWAICILFIFWSLAGERTAKILREKPLAKYFAYFLLIMAPVVAPVIFASIVLMTISHLFKFYGARGRLEKIAVELRQMADYASDHVLDKEMEDRLQARWEALEVESEELMDFIERNGKKVE